MDAISRIHAEKKRFHDFTQQKKTSRNHATLWGASYNKGYHGRDIENFGNRILRVSPENTRKSKRFPFHKQELYEQQLAEICRGVNNFCQKF